MKKNIFYSLTFLITVTAYSATGQTLTRKILTGVSDSYPMLSTDNKKILFHTNRFGPSEICIMNANGSNLTRLTFNNTDDNSPVWSPDNTKIVFASERDGNSEIYIMDSDGKNQKRLTNSWGDDSHPKFYENGRRIIFNSPRNTKDTTLPWSRQTMEVFSMNIDGSDVKQMTFLNSFCTYSAVSPDGTKLVCRQVIAVPGFNWDLSTASRNSEVIVMNIDGSNAINLSANAAFDGWPTWTPDGKIIFTSNRGGVPYYGQLYRINADGTDLTQLTDKNNCYIQASVSMDGKSIVCQHEIAGEDFDYGGIAITYPEKK